MRVLWRRNENYHGEEPHEHRETAMENMVDKYYTDAEWNGQENGNQHIIGTTTRTHSLIPC